jgi:peroxiredoxin Q/BCP
LAGDYNRFTAAGAEIIAISVDNQDKNRELSDKLKLPFAVLSDADHKVIDAYDLYNPDGKIAKPAVFVIDKSGVVRWTFFDEDYRVRAMNDAILSELAKLNAKR